MRKLLVAVGRHGRGLLIVVLMSLLSCLDTQSTVCPSGLICGPGLVCAAVQETCIETPCGDGLIQDGEICDDGNILSGDGCNSDCTSDETCGNRTKDPHEKCDDGNEVPLDGCSADCQSDETCGNEVVDTLLGEVCDDGKNISGDRCSADCRSLEYCGNGYLDVAKGELCDDGNTNSRDGCSADCRSREYCGNNYLDVELDERCDDGDTRDGDGCSANCRSDETCGNGIKDPLEACDDGNNSDEGVCSADCMVAGTGCPNGRLDPGEECDDGGTTDTDECTSHCKWARCGDGIIASDAVPPRYEDCDGSGETSTCDLDCTSVKCGDGVVNGTKGEECDSGQENTDTATCTQFCGISRCGDGYVNGAAKEKCDDENADACGTCDALCKQEPSLAQATGYIKAISENEVWYTDEFTINNGVGMEITFEFTRGNESDKPTRKFIKIVDDASPADVADAIIAKINGVQDFQITAVETDPRSEHIDLKHNLYTALGNRSITESVLDRDFKVSGMEGGKGRDCPEKFGCKSTDDCAVGLQCDDGVCLKP